MRTDSCRKIRVLVDDISALKSPILLETLKALGFVVDVARNSDQILCAIEHNYSMLFCYVKNCTVEGLQGEVARAWLRNFPAVIAFIDPGQPDLRDQCIAIGMADVLERPISSDALYECICSLSASLNKLSLDASTISSNSANIVAPVDLEVLA